MKGIVMNSRYILRSLALLIMVGATNWLHAISFLSRNDPFPMYSSMYPRDYLLSHTKKYRRGLIDDDTQERVSFSVSPFYQSARTGKNRHRLRTELGDILGPWSVIGLMYGPEPCGQQRGPILQKAFEQAKFCGNPGLCEAIQDATTTTQTRFMHDQAFSDPDQRFGFLTVPLRYRKVGLRFEGLGMLSDHVGVGFRIGFADISQTLQGTNCNRALVCDDFCESTVPICIFQESELTCTSTVTRSVRIIAPGFVDLTPLARPRLFPTTSGCSFAPEGTSCFEELFGPADKRVMEAFLISRLKEVFQEIGLDVCDFHDTSIEDAIFELFWRRPYEVNNGCESGYSNYMFIPFASLEFSLGIATERDPCKAFSLPFGNNGHHAVAFTAGFDLDFVDSIEIGIEAGVTHLFDRNFYDVFLTAHPCQHVLYPFKTDIHVEPGNNWHFMATLNAPYFVDRASFYGSYIFVNHDEDTICLTGSNKGILTTVAEPGSDDCMLSPVEPATGQCCDFDECDFTTSDVNNAFKPERLAKDSCFSAQMFNAALNYDLSPWSSIGLLWQIPITRQAAYRTNTVLFTYRASF